MVVLGMDLGPHVAAILASYGLAVLTVAGLIAWIVLDHRLQARDLAALEARGVRRRSGRAALP
jgi:heme exporter protein D